MQWPLARARLSLQARDRRLVVGELLTQPRDRAHIFDRETEHVFVHRGEKIPPYVHIKAAKEY